MSMQPNSCELLWLSAKINLVFKKVCHRFIVEFNADCRYFLFNSNKVSDKQQVVRTRNAETSNFIV